MKDTQLKEVEINERVLGKVSGGTDEIAKPNYKFELGEIVFFGDDGAQAQVVGRRAELIMGGKGFGCFYDLKTLKTSTFIPDVDEKLLKKVLKDLF